VKYLLSKGADPTQQDFHKESPLELAKLNQNGNIISVLEKQLKM